MSTAIGSAQRSAPRAAADALRRAVREHSLLIGFVALHLALSAAMPTILGRELSFRFSLLDGYRLLGLIGLWVILIAVGVNIVVAVLRARPRHPLAFVGRHISERHVNGTRIAGGLVMLGLFPPFAISFGYLKAMIPILHPFAWDPTLAAWDRWLHGGRAPWEWLQPMLGFPLVTSMLSAAYATWFFVLYGVVFWQAFARRDPVRRMQYFLSSILIWTLLGNLGATLLSSAGPVYFARATGLADPYQPLLDYLHAASRQWPNFSIGLQSELWRVYLTSGKDGIVNGSISAMPSVHVATAFSFFLVGRTVHKALGAVFALFTLLILVATVHLGWHYAIDGYAGILGALLIWHAVGRLLRWPWLARWLWGEDDRSDPARIRENAGITEPALGPTRGTG